MADYEQGALVRVRNAFTTRALTASELATFKSDGTLPAVGVAPSSVTFKWQAPDGTETTPSVSEGASVGSYYVDINTTSQAGSYRYQWLATGTYQAAEFGSFEVSDSDF